MIGLVVALVVLALSFAVPPLFGWDVDARSDMLGLPPLHGFVDLRASPTSVLAVLLAAAGVWRGEALARTLSWRRLLLASYVVGLAWLVALALVDGEVGLTRVMVSPTEYMVSAREITDVPAMLREYVDRIPYSAPDNWPIHLAGHPPGAVLFHVALVRVGLGGDLAAALVAGRDRGQHPARDDDDPAPARRRALGPPRGALPGADAGRGVPRGLRRRALRRAGRLGTGRARGLGAVHRPRAACSAGASPPGCCWAGA